ncbi:MAG: hypothetical protein JOZ97_08090 [Candidatus Eremiobacteraeota bacterium]|nr:hypothetical protein [Candidatus Eremiobacteraeota bacterium]
MKDEKKIVRDKQPRKPKEDRDYIGFFNARDNTPEAIADAFCAAMVKKGYITKP